MSEASYLGEMNIICAPDTAMLQRRSIRDFIRRAFYATAPFDVNVCCFCWQQQHTSVTNRLLQEEQISQYSGLIHVTQTPVAFLKQKARVSAQLRQKPLLMRAGISTIYLSKTQNTMDSPYRKELLTAIAVVQQAAALSRAVLAADDKGTTSKDDLSPVTVADFAIQALLTATLHEAFPNDAFVGEESADELRSNDMLLNRVFELLQRADQKPGCTLPSSKEQMCQMIDWCGHGVPKRDAGSRTWVFDPIDGEKSH